MTDINSEVDTLPAREEVEGPDGVKGHVYAIPHPNLPTFYERFAKLVKRATKLGVEAPSYQELRQQPKVFKKSGGTDPETGLDRVIEYVIMYHHLAVFHPKVVVSGWEFIAKLEHTPEGNILHTLPGKTTPSRYRDCESQCDHCQLRRRRNDTFVLYSETEEKYQQVGRNCLADFLGKDAERYADAAEVYYTTDQLGSASEAYDGEGGGGGLRYEMLDRYLSYVAEVISLVGWRSRSTAFNSGGMATADIATNHLLRTRYDPRTDLFQYPTEKSGEVAKASIQWAENLSDGEVEASEYLHNIRVIARRGVVGSKQFGYAASIVSSYQRHLSKHVETDDIRHFLTSSWVGEVGKRQLFFLTVEAVITIQSDWGVSLLHRMMDEDGNKFTWFANRGDGFQQGDHLLLRGTVKKHDTYKGEQQTTISRCEKVVLKSYIALVNGERRTLDAENEKDARKRLATELKVARLPRGTAIIPTQPE